MRHEQTFSMSMPLLQLFKKERVNTFIKRHVQMYQRQFGSNFRKNWLVLFTCFSQNGFAVVVPSVYLPSDGDCRAGASNSAWLCPVPYCACAAVWRRTVFHASQQQRVIFMVFKFAKACAWLATAMGWPASVPEVPWGRYGPVAGFLRMTNGFKSCILAYPCHPSKTCANFILVARLWFSGWSFGAFPNAGFCGGSGLSSCILPRG